MPDTIHTLNDLITTALDGVHGYKQAADNASDPSLKVLFEDYSRQRSSFATELQAIVRQHGGEPTEIGSVKAAFHRGWIGLKDKLTSGDKGILGECVRGDEYAKKQYADAVAGTDVPSADRVVLEQQHGQISQALAHMNNLHRQHA